MLPTLIAPLISATHTILIYLPDYHVALLDICIPGGYALSAPLAVYYDLPVYLYSTVDVTLDLDYQALSASALPVVGLINHALVILSMGGIDESPVLFG